MIFLVIVVFVLTYNKGIKMNNLLRTKEAADFLGIPARTLENWRCNQRYNLPYIKIGRLIRYRMIDLVAWINSSRITVDKDILN